MRVVDKVAQVCVAPLNSSIALAIADAIVYATAQEFGADLLTCDTHFEKLPGVVFIRKPLKA